MSDLHLALAAAMRGVLDFLKHNEFERLYLVGDVIDLWRLRKDGYCRRRTTMSSRKFFASAQGRHVIVIPGNHDEFCLNFSASTATSS